MRVRARSVGVAVSSRGGGGGGRGRELLVVAGAVRRACSCFGAPPLTPQGTTAAVAAAVSMVSTVVSVAIGSSSAAAPGVDITTASPKARWWLDMAPLGRLR